MKQRATATAEFKAQPYIQKDHSSARKPINITSFAYYESVYNVISDDDTFDI